MFKGSASQLNKLVLKDSHHIKKLSGSNLFPRSRYQYIYQQRVVANNEWLLIATSGCEQRVVAGTFGRGFLKVGICIDDETWEKD